MKYPFLVSLEPIGEKTSLPGAEDRSRGEEGFKRVKEDERLVKKSNKLKRNLTPAVGLQGAAGAAGQGVVDIILRSKNGFDSSCRSQK